MDTTASPDFLFNLLAVVVAFVLFLGYLVLNVMATQRVIGKLSGAAVPAWVLVIWLLPVIGFLSAFATLKQSDNQGGWKT